MHARIHNNIHGSRLRKELAVKRRSTTRAETKVKELKLSMIEQKKIIDEQFTLQQHFAEAQQRFVLSPATGGMVGGCDGW